MASPSAVRLAIGDCILVQIGHGPGQDGVGLIKYIGFIHGHGMTEYIGIELVHKVAHGHNGTINGYQYFTTPKGHALHIKLNNVIRKLTVCELFQKFKNDFSVIERKLNQCRNTGKQLKKLHHGPTFEPGKHFLSKTSRRTSNDSLSRSITRITTDASPMPTALDMENLCSLRPSISLRSKNENNNNQKNKRKSQLPIIQDEIYDHLPLTPNETSNCYSISEYLNDASSLCQTNTTRSSFISTASSRSYQSQTNDDNTSCASRSISVIRRKKKKAKKKYHKKSSKKIKRKKRRNTYSHSPSVSISTNDTVNAKYLASQSTIDVDISNMSTKQTSSPVVKMNNNNNNGTMLMSFHRHSNNAVNGSLNNHNNNNTSNLNHNSNNNNNLVGLNNLLVREQIANGNFAQYNPLNSFPDLNYGNHLIAQGLVYQSSTVPSEFDMKSVRLSQSRSQTANNNNNNNNLPTLSTSQHHSNSHQDQLVNVSNNRDGGAHGNVGSLRLYFDAESFYKQQQQIMAKKYSRQQQTMNVPTNNPYYPSHHGGYVHASHATNYSPQTSRTAPSLHHSSHHSPNLSPHNCLPDASPQLQMYSLSAGNHNRGFGPQPR